MEQICLLSIIIPAYNHKDELIGLLDSIAKCITSDIEVLVIDDGSNIPLKNIVLSYGFNYFYQKNNGPATARNQGARLTNGKFMLFLDSDLELPHDALLKVLDVIKNPEFKIGSLQYHPNTIGKGFASEFKGFFDAYNILYNRQPGPIKALNGSCALFEREAFFKTGGWNEDFDKPDMEHEEFSVRIRKLYAIVVYPDILFYHRFPKLKELLTLIFLRTISWVRLKMNNKVAYDDITRTKAKAIIALMPLFISLMSLLGFFNKNAWLIVIPAVVIYFICNIPFYRFLFSRSSFVRTFVYICIHFVFLLCVGLGGVIGVMTCCKSKV